MNLENQLFCGFDSKAEASRQLKLCWLRCAQSSAPKCAWKTPGVCLGAEVHPWESSQELGSRSAQQG